MQTLIFGLTFGGIYALMALAIGMINSTTRIMNFAHANLVMLGAMFSHWLCAIVGLGYWPSFLIALVANTLVGILLYKICVETLGNLANNSNWVVTQFGFSHILANGARMLFGNGTYPYDYMFNGARIRIGGVNILWHEILMILLAIVIGVAYQTMSSKTSFGRATRAVAWKSDTAQLMGINSNMIKLFGFAMAGAIAALTGILLAPVTYANYNMTASIGLKGFAAALIGGNGNTMGALIGGFALGLFECVLGLFVSSAIRDAISFAVMILVIIFLPGGVIGAKIFTKGSTTTEKV